MKKRNLLLLVCIILAAALTLVSCGNRGNDEPPHEHTYDTTKYVSDATGHWYGASCEHTDLKLNVAEHDDANKDGVCDTCEYVTCTHTYNENEWVSDENNHWHAASCGCEMKKDVAAHVDSNKDGLCDECEYVTCTHTIAEDYSSDENGHWYAYTCGCELTPEVEPHADADKNGICDSCGYVTCAHNPEEAWSTDVFNHWHATDCGCLVKIDEAAHIDEDADGDCDVCGFVCEHPASDVWETDADNHWHNPVCNHEAGPFDLGAHEDDNKDGACDVCGYEDPTHEHTFAVAYNKNQHYMVSNCGHFIAKDFENHVDADEDGVCDGCNAYVGGLTEIVDSTTSDEAAGKINASTASKATGTDSDPYVQTNSVTFGKDYTILHTDYSNDYLSTYVGPEGQPSLFYISVYEDDSKSVNSYVTDVALMKGIELDLLYSFQATGTEAYVYGLYDYAQQNTVYAYSESYDATAGVYAFSYVIEEVDWDNAVTIKTVSVEVTVVDGAISKVVATALAYEVATDYSLDKTNNVLFIYNDEPASKQVVTIEQTVGARSEEPNPHKAENYLITELVIYNQATGEEIKEGDVIEISVGKDNALLITLPEADVDKIDYNNIYFDKYDNWDIIASAWEYPFAIYTMDDAGEFPITISSTMGGNINFTVKVNYIAPNSLTAAVVNGEEMVEASSVETYAGVPVVIGAIADSSAGSPEVTATVTTGDPDAVTLTADGTNWIVSSNEVGTYTITLTSTMAPSVKTSISLVVVDAPAPEDILKGNYALTADYGETMSVKFIPEYEGAISGTVEIEFDNGMYYGRVIISEKATYSFAAGEIVLTHLEGDGIAQVALAITPAYEVALRFYPSPEYDPEYYDEFVLEKAPDDPVVVEPNGTTEAPYILSESTTLELDLAEGEIVYYLFTPSSNGTAGFSVVGGFEDYSVNWGTFNFMILDNSLWSPSKTFEVTKNVPVYIGISTYSGDAGKYTVEFTFEGETPAGPTLESLAGTWEGYESGSMIYGADKQFALTLNIGADGTGTGNHAEYGAFNITGVTIDGMNVSVVTDCVKTLNQTLQLVYDGSSLVLADGAQNMTFGNVISLTKTSSAGGSEGGDSDFALAGTWEGVESGSMIYQGKEFAIVLNIKGDGTGTGSHEECGEFNILSTAVDGTSVTIVTDCAGTTNKTLNLALVDGKLTLASGMGMMFGNTIELVQTSTGSSEGGDEPVVAPTLEELAGDWTGSEDAQGFMANYTVTINADGTGSGSYTSGVGPGAYTTTFDITAVTIDGATVTVSTITTGEYGGSTQDVVFTYADGTLSSDKGLMWGTLTLTK